MRPILCLVMLVGTASAQEPSDGIVFQEEMASLRRAYALALAAAELRGENRPLSEADLRTIAKLKELYGNAYDPPDPLRQLMAVQALTKAQMETQRIVGGSEYPPVPADVDDAPPPPPLPGEAPLPPPSSVGYRSGRVTYYTVPQVQYVKRFPPTAPPPPPTESRKTYTKVQVDELPEELEEKVWDLIEKGEAFAIEGPFPRGCYLLPEWIMWQYRQEIKDASDKLRRGLDAEKLKQLDDAVIYIPSA